MAYIIFLTGMFFLIVGGNVLVDSSIIIARKLKISPLLIGIFLIGFGTSMPELTTSLLAVARRAEGIAIGNVVGSNIANILLVLGVAAFIKPIKIHTPSFGRDAIFLGLATIILLISLLAGHISWELGALMCMTLAFYVYHAYQTDKEHIKTQSIELPRIALAKRFHLPTYLSIILAISGLVLMLLGAHMVVNSVILLASHWGISETLIGLTIVAFGTSLPELVTAIIASLKKQSDLVIGNVVGSNIYNALFILGFTALFLPVSVPLTVKPNVLIMTAATMLLLGLGWWHGKISKRIGLLFILMYFSYIFYVGMA